MFGLLYKNDLFQDGCFHYSVTNVEMLKTKDLNDLKQRKNNKKSTKQLLILNHLRIYCIPQLCLFVLKLVVNHTVSQCSLTHLAIIYLKKEKANLPPLIYRCPILLKRVTPGKEPAWARMLSQPHTNTTLLSSGVRGSPYLIVRTEMQYFHIRFHMPLTSSGQIWLV